MHRTNTVMFFCENIDLLQYSHCYLLLVAVVLILGLALSLKANFLWPWPWLCKAGLGIKLGGLNFELYQSLV